MRTNIDIDDALIGEAMRASGLRTKRDVVHAALERLVNAHARRRVLELRGTVPWDGDLDAMRRVE